MDFATDLNRVLKYGRLVPRSEWEPHTNDMASHVNTEWPTHPGQSVDEFLKHPVGVLADKFGDHDDPREHILRGQPYDPLGPDQLALHSHTSPGDDRVRFAERRTALSDGSALTAQVLSPLTNDTETRVPSHVSLTWMPRRTGEGHTAVFSPDEARNVLSKFRPDDAPELKRIHSLIDHHFPQHETAANKEPGLR